MFDFIPHDYIRSVSGIVLVHDITNRGSFNRIVIPNNSQSFVLDGLKSEL